jgi:beta-glucosidase
LHARADLLTQVLKGRWDFYGFVIGDWNGHAQIPGCTEDSCPQAFLSGVDMFMAPTKWRELYANTLAQVRSGQIPMARLDDAVYRILRVKGRLGLFLQPQPSARAPAGQFNLLGAPDHRAVARRAVQESLVLLKNEGSILPLAQRRFPERPVDLLRHSGRGARGWRNGGAQCRWALHAEAGCRRRRVRRRPLCRVQGRPEDHSLLRH